MPNYQAITRQRHGQQHWQHPSTYAFAATDLLALLTAAELPSAAMSLPIAFVQQGQAFVPVAVLGLQLGQNLFVGPDGRWLGNYLPAALRSYPFCLAPPDNGQQVLCIDEDGGLCGNAPEAERFFGDDGQPSPALQQVLSTLTQAEQSRLATTAACAVLAQHSLIQPWPVTLKTDAGELQLTGLFRIDEAALNQLPSDALHAVSQAGGVALAYCQLLSMQHLSRLGELVSSTNRTKVLLVTYQWSTLMEMPHLVKQAGCEVHVLCPADNWTIKNSFYDQWIDAGATMESLLAALTRLANDQVYQYILIGDDPILWKIYRDKIDALWHLLPIGNPAALPLLNKVGLSEHCRDHGIASPEFWRIDRKEDASAALQRLGLPIVVKENYSNGGEGVRVFQDQAAYFEFMDGYDYAEPLLAQKFMAGEPVGVEALFKHGKLLEYVNSVPIEPTLGPSRKRRYFPNDEKIGDLVRQIGSTARLHGFANIKMMRDTLTQECYLFESDPRPNKWTPYARWFGRDFVGAFKVFMADGDGTVAEQPDKSEAVGCWDVEYYPDYASKLFTSGRTIEAFNNLLNFDLNYKFTIYDPVLLKAKMEALRSTLTFE